jgi:predicted Rossmann fold nucleotide-binding protein DprA/Smf involved in DNA uptake
MSMNALTTQLDLDHDAQAVLLLCGYFSRQQKDDVKPLTLGEYNRVASWLNHNNMRPADLLTPDGRKQLQAWQDQKVNLERLQGLLDRGVALGFAVEKWSSQGIWVMSRSDDRYPKRLKERLRSNAPVLLYGVGSIDLLNQGGLAVVGSRDADEAASLFTNVLAERCAKEDITVISGDAKGVDREAMTTALDTGGTVIGVLPEGVAKASVKRDYRKAIQEGRLVLASVLYPDAPWSIANAMSRNKYIFTLSDHAVVVASSTDGGTWAGATENLRRGWVKLFVRSDEPMLEGNKMLLERGAVPFNSASFRSNTPLKTYFDGDFTAARTTSLESPRPDQAGKSLENVGSSDLKMPEDSQATDLFEVVWPHLAAALREARTPKELADLFDVQKTQMNSWLKRAVEEKRVKKLAKPVRYVIDSQVSLPFEPPRFKS